MEVGTAGVIFATREYLLDETTRMKLTEKKQMRWPAAWTQPYLKSGTPGLLLNKQTSSLLLKCRWIISPNTAFLISSPLTPNIAATLKLPTAL